MVTFSNLTSPGVVTSHLASSVWRSSGGSDGFSRYSKILSTALSASSRSVYVRKSMIMAPVKPTAYVRTRPAWGGESAADEYKTTVVKPCTTAPSAFKRIESQKLTALRCSSAELVRSTNIENFAEKHVTAPSKARSVAKPLRLSLKQENTGDLVVESIRLRSRATRRYAMQTLYEIYSTGKKHGSSSGTCAPIAKSETRGWTAPLMTKVTELPTWRSTAWMSVEKRFWIRPTGDRSYQLVLLRSTAQLRRSCSALLALMTPQFEATMARKRSRTKKAVQAT
mmetsp:Transcript_16175/g.54553  ORF Transcript_16175/g.54553 Transcript_16175/m.54553 type:complete len:282 (+) Transcript_16175:803-1648(+)